ncbi:hypothetical protein MLD52_19525 [Puniceicoccaceae bacterium K14]|nr:hypothetical protein [Puniceicoccaceae bacterium K14]
MTTSTTTKLMVIGDSLGQGTQALSVTPETVKWAPANIVAKQLGWDFQNIPLDGPVIVDLEEIASDVAAGDLWTLFGIKDKIVSRLSYWENYFKSEKGSDIPEFVHNMAVAGAEARHLYTTLDQHWATFVESKKRVESIEFNFANIGMLIGNVVEASIAISFVYCINPRNLPGRGSWTVLDVVEKLRPENLLVSIGHNDGILDIVRGGVTSVDDTRVKNVMLALKPHLEKAGKSSKVYIASYPLSRIPTALISSGAKVNGYYESYESFFSLTQKVSVSRSEMMASDQKVRNLNKFLRETFDRKNICILDTSDVYESIDSRHDGDGIFVFDERLARNYFITNLVPKTKRKRIGPRSRHRRRYGPRYLEKGGLISFDFVHPSGTGYVVYAKCFLNVLGHSLSEEDEKRLLSSAFSDDVFYSDPENFDWIIVLIRKLKRSVSAQAGANDASPIESTDAKLVAIEAYAKCMFGNR